MPSVSEKQQRFFGMVHAYQKGELDTSNMSPAQKIRIQRVAKNMSQKATKDFAETKYKGLSEKVAGLAGSMLGSAAGSIAGASLMDKRYRGYLEAGMPTAPERYFADVLKGSIIGATVGAGAGHLIGKGLSQARKIQKLKAPRKETMSLLKSHASKQKIVIDEVKRFGMKRDLAEFSELRSYKVNPNIKMTTERAMRHYGGKKGLNTQNMTQEVLDDVYKQTYDKIWVTDRKRAKRFRKAWKRRQFGGREDMTMESFIHVRAAKRFGFTKSAEAYLTDAIVKYAAGKYEDVTYRSHVRSVSGKERVVRGVMSSGVPSALLTGALGLASGIPYRSAMKAAIGVGILGTTIGAMSASAKQRVFVPSNG